MVGYDGVEGWHILDPVFSNYLTFVEQSMKYVTMNYVDVDILKNVPYHPNVAGFDYCHKVMAKDQEQNGTSCLYNDMLYPAELKLVYCKDSILFEALVH